jgi:hypothetical protein
MKNKANGQFVTMKPRTATVAARFNDSLHNLLGRQLRINVSKKLFSLERWVAKLVVFASLASNPDISKQYKIGDTLARQEHKKTLFLLLSENIKCCFWNIHCKIQSFF